MKPRDLMLLGVTAVIFIVAGFLVVAQLQPKNSKADSKNIVEVAPAIPSGFDSNALQTLNDGLRVKNFSVKIDLRTGLGNTKPLGAF